MKASDLLRKQLDRRRPRGVRRRGIAGNQSGVVRGSKPGYIYVSLNRAGGLKEIVEAVSSTVPAARTPLIVEEDPLSNPPQRVVVGIDGEAFEYNGGAGDPGVYLLPAHAFTHEYGGTDEIALHIAQITFLRVETSSLRKHITLREGAYIAGGEMYLLSAEQDIDLTEYYSDTGQTYVWVCAGSGGPYVVAAYAEMLSGLEFPPVAGTFGDSVIAAIRLRAAMPVTRDDIFDVRLFGMANGNATRLWGRAVASTPPDDDNVLTWVSSASEWRPVAPSGGGSNGGGSSTTADMVSTPHWYADGPIAVASEVDGRWYVDVPVRITEVWISCETTGTSGDTIVDIERSTDGVSFSTLFTDSADRPTLAHDDADHQAVGTPDDDILNVGDVLRMCIDGVAAGARSLSVMLIGESGSGIHDDYDLTNLGCG